MIKKEILNVFIQLLASFTIGVIIALLITYPPNNIIFIAAISYAVALPVFLHLLTHNRLDKLTKLTKEVRK